MRWFKNRNTMTKLLIGFMVVTAIMVVVGLNGLRSMGGVQGSFQDTHQNQLVPITHLATARGLMLRTRIDALNHVLAQDPGRMRDLEAEIKQFDAGTAEEMAKFAAARLTQEEKDSLAKFKQAWTQFKEGRNAKTLPLSAAGKKDEALAAALGEVGQRYREASEAIDQLFAAKVKAAGAAVEAGNQQYAATSRLTILVLLVGIALSIGLGFGIARIIARPLSEVAGTLRRVAGGDLTVTVEVESKDEVGQVAEATRKMVEGLREVMVQVAAGATHVAGAAQQMSAGAAEISNGAQEQASSLEETASSMEQMASTIKQTADNARQANQLALSSRDVADKGGRVVADAVGAMGEINKASKQIADIISVIDEIAFQTNLLALNAAVEAARAGEQGRGFAVVASEVRSLAQRAATSAKEIKKLIQDSVQKVQNGSELVTQSGKTLEEIVVSVKRVAEIVSEIAAASQEQAAGIDQVNKAITQMDQVTQSNAAQVEELSSTSQSMAAQAEQLQALIKRFKIEEGREAAVRTAAPVHAHAALTPSGPTLKAEVIVRRARPKVLAKKAEPALVGSLADNGKGDGFEEF